MTLPEILKKYAALRADARNYDDWTALNKFVRELAELASGQPIIPSDDVSEGHIFNEVRA